jgi:uncharacterized protein (TIGR03435 family)
MTFRLPMLLLTLVVGGMFAQPGMFGPISVHLKAGDFAPDLVFNGMLNAGGATPWTTASLSGQMAVLAFFPDTSHNIQSVTRWNALVAEFADKPIQFVWITGERESSLLLWLQEHPIQGWVFHDPDRATGRAYGMETPVGVIIGDDRRIVGFDENRVPDKATLTAALEGRLLHLNAEPPRMPRADDHKPDFPPSYTVHISPAKTADGGDFSNNRFHNFQGITLRHILAQVFDVNPVRILLPAALDDDKLYDVAIVLPDPEPTESISNRIVQAIQDHFGVIATREERLLDVYVVNTANGRSPAPLARSDDDRGGGASFGRVEIRNPKYVGAPGELPSLVKPASLGDIQAISSKGTIDEFCRMLELGLDRPLVNETNLEGEYEFNLNARSENENDFLERLRDQFNLNIIPAQRRVQMVVLKPR